MQGYKYSLTGGQVSDVAALGLDAVITVPLNAPVGTVPTVGPITPGALVNKSMDVSTLALNIRVSQPDNNITVSSGAAGNNEIALTPESIQPFAGA